MIKNKPTYLELEKEVEILKTKKEIKTSLEFNQNLLVEINAKGIVTHVNQKMCEVLGYKEKEIIGKNWFDNFLPKKTKVKILSISKKLLQGETESVKDNENPILTKNGEEKIIRWHNAIIRNKKGTIIGHLSTGEDITEIKKVEATLLQASHIIERSPAVVFLWKNQNNWLVEYVSNNVQQIFEYTAEDFSTNKIAYLKLIHPEDLNAVSAEIKKYSENNSTEFEHKHYRIITKSGKIKWVKDRTQIRRNEKGEITYYEGIILDITKNKKRQEELIKLNTAIKNSTHEVHVFNADNLKFTFVNEITIKNLGYSLEELKNMTPIDLTPQFNHKEALKKLTPLRSGKIDRLSFETFRQRKDKTLYPVEINVSTFKIDDKLHFLALVIDTTEQNKSKAALIESESRFKTIIENAGDAMYMANFNGDILQVNELACKALGYSKKELLSMKIFEIDANIIKDKHPKKLWSTLKPNNPQTLETIHKRKDGSTFPVEIRIGVAIVNNEKVTLGFARDITERKISEKKLKDSEFLLNEAQKIAQLGSYTLNIESGFWTTSLVLDTLFGIDKNYKKDIDGWLKIIHPKDKKMMFNHLSTNVLINHEFFDKEYRILRNNDKEERWVHGLGKLEFNEEGKPIRMLGTIQDITEQKKVEETLLQKNLQIKEQNKQLIKSEKKFRGLYEKSGDAIMIGKNGKFVDLNNAALHMFGYTSKEKFLKTKISDLYPKIQPDGSDSYVKSKEMLGAAFENGTHRFEFTHKKKNGKIFPVEILLTAISNKNDNKVMHGVLRDISNRKLIEAELIQAKEKAEESDRLKTEFINNMSHEIRTPMNGIMGFSEFLADPNLADEKRKYFVKIIKNSGHQLLQIIDDILEISRLGTKQVKVFEESVNLNNLLLELFSIFDTKAKENKTPLYLEKGLLDKQSTILTDKTKLNKIISNLLENALKFTNVGTIEFGYNLIENNKLRQLEMYVKDTGKGIKKEDQKLIFERFSQAEKEISKNTKGLGLGLSIAKENTELLGGKISVDSTKGKGTTFYVTIPYKPIFKDEDIKIEHIEEKQTVLIVEDEEVNYLYLSTLIQDILKLNCTVLHAKNGKEAIKIYKENSSIAVILMDLKMPIMNGYDATTAIKKINPNIPIIAQTAYSTKTEIKKAIAFGCDDFISKPISKESLFKIITKFVPNI
ncbi:MAG: PAS domain S-box protein [Lutibacter sp.]|uniref:PAS domain S-box protein n=1 Tax=Lutibacter sp. TaxID=1925666 RepID=UPI00385D53DE